MVNHQKEKALRFSPQGLFLFREKNMAYYEKNAIKEVYIMISAIKNLMAKPFTWGGYLKLYGISFLIGVIYTLFMFRIPQTIFGNIMDNIAGKTNKKHSKE